MNEIIVAIIISIPPLIVALLTLRQARIIHLSINSRMDQLLKSTKGESLAEGREIGRNENK